MAAGHAGQWPSHVVVGRAHQGPGHPRTCEAGTQSPALSRSLNCVPRAGERDLGRSQPSRPPPAVISCVRAGKRTWVSLPSPLPSRGQPHPAPCPWPGALSPWTTPPPSLPRGSIAGGGEMPRTPAGWSQSLWGCLERGSGSAVLGARMKRQAGETASWGQLIQGPRLPPGRDPTDTYPPLSEAGAPARLQAGSSAPAARGPVCCVLGGPLAELWAPGWTKQAPGVGVQVGR